MNNLSQSNSNQRHTMRDLFQFLRDNRLKYVDNRSKGGSLWIECTKEQTDLINFMFGDLDIYFVFKQTGGNTIHHRPGCFSKKNTAPSSPSENYNFQAYTKDENGLFQFLLDYNFEYKDNRPKGGSLWIVCSSRITGAINFYFSNSGMRFIFTAKGGSATQSRPGCYSRPADTSPVNPVFPQPAPVSVSPPEAKSLPTVTPATIKQPVQQAVPPVEPIRPEQTSTPPKAAAQGSGCLVALVATVAVLGLICML